MAEVAAIIKSGNKDLPITRVNEHLTSFMANKLLFDLNPALFNSKETNDQIAACLILKDFIGWAKDYAHTNNLR